MFVEGLDYIDCYFVFWDYLIVYDKVVEVYVVFKCKLVVIDDGDWDMYVFGKDWFVKEI